MASDATPVSIPATSGPIISANILTEAQKVQILWATIFGSEEPPVRGLVKAFKVLDSLQAEVEELSSNRRFWLNVATQVLAIALAWVVGRMLK